MSSSRTNLIVFAACAAFVGIVAGVKVDQERQRSSDLYGSVAVKNAPAQNIPETVDSSFYETATTSASASESSGASSEPFTPSVSIAPAVPADTVSAAAYLVGDVSTGKIYLEKNPRMPFPIASMTKLITAITVIGTYASSTEVEITAPETQVAPDLSDLRSGERFTVGELLYPLLLDSSNVAAEALASSTDRAAFLSSMAAYAEEIGMNESAFADPSGLSEGNIGSADDFMALATYLYHSRPDILSISRTLRLSVATTTDHGAHEFLNIHPFASDPRFLGGKTGHTNAAEDTMITILNIDGHPLAFIVLRSLDRTRDTQLLIGKVEDILLSAGNQ
jgi:D-alanyl-D-alanine carboxypeptidase